MNARSSTAGSAREKKSSVYIACNFLNTSIRDEVTENSNSKNILSNMLPLAGGLFFVLNAFGISANAGSNFDQRSCERWYTFGKGWRGVGVQGSRTAHRRIAPDF